MDSSAVKRYWSRQLVVWFSPNEVVSMSDSIDRLVEVMDVLRSPGGCPWDAEQTHESLARYLLEETYETLEAMDQGDQVALKEELGDLLLQVVFHARIAQESDAQFTLDAIAGAVVEKLERRHPHPPKR